MENTRTLASAPKIGIPMECTRPLHRMSTEGWFAHNLVLFSSQPKINQANAVIAGIIGVQT